MKNININEPCNENWAEMTPTQQGAFCSKCSINVVDFSNKSKNEIKLILLKNNGGMCGRLKKSQIDELNADFEAWKAQKPKTFQSRFLFALIMVFGLTLFSCSHEEAAVIQEMSINRIVLNDNVSNFKTAIEPIREAEELNPIRFQDDQFKLNLEPIIEEANYKIQTLETVEVISSNEQIMVAGGLNWSGEYEEYILETIPNVDLEIETEEKVLTQEEIDLANQPKFESKLYPNPSITNSTLDLKVVKEGQYEINLFDMNGQLVQKIHSGLLSEGETRFQLEISDLHSGTYLIVILSEGEKETLNLQKVN